MASHLTLEEREVIAHRHRNGAMQTEISKPLARSKSTLSRELRRNRSRNGYWAVAPQKKAENGAHSLRRENFSARESWRNLLFSNRLPLPPELSPLREKYAQDT